MGSGDAPTPHFAYTEAFEKAFPQYLAMGMTYDQFWNDDVELVKFYREAFLLKQQLKEQDMWIQGAYFCEAIASCFADKKKPVHYPKEPHGYFEKHRAEKQRLAKEQQSDNKAKAMMEMLMVSINKKFEKKGGEENGS